MNWRMMFRASIAALLPVVFWRHSANHPVSLGFVFAAGAALVIMALFLIHDRFETRFALADRPDAARRFMMERL